MHAASIFLHNTLHLLLCKQGLHLLDASNPSITMGVLPPLAGIMEVGCCLFYSVSSSGHPKGQLSSTHSQLPAAGHSAAASQKLWAVSRSRLICKAQPGQHPAAAVAAVRLASGAACHAIRYHSTAAASHRGFKCICIGRSSKGQRSLKLCRYLRHCSYASISTACSCGA